MDSKTKQFMKQFFFLILLLSVIGSNAQNVTDLSTARKISTQYSAKRTIDPASPASLRPENRLPRHAAGSRAQNLSFYMDYGALDQEFASNVTFGDYYDDIIFQVNRRPALDSTGIYKWAFQWYPQIVDFVNAPTWPFVEYPANQIQMTIDTVFLFMGHIRNSNQTDTIQISVWDLDALTSINFADSGCTGTLYGRILATTDTSLTAAGAQPGSVQVGVLPFVPTAPIVIPQGKRFIIQVDFFGAPNDEFYLIAGRRNDCGNASCGASIPYIHDTYNASIADFNSLAGVRYVDGTNDGIYPSTLFYNDCNQNQTQDTAASACELFVLQDWGIYPNIQAVIPNFYANVTAPVASACPNSNVVLTASAGGSSDPNYTYNWSTTSGSLSSSSDQEVTLTLGSSNATVIVTVTDGANQTTLDTIVINSKGININITSANPLSIPCGGTGTITSQLSGTTAGKIYTWSTGATGANVPTVSVSGPGTYTVTVTNNSGCSASASTTVDYSGGATNTPNFTSPSPICVGKPAVFTNTSTKKDNGWSATWNMLGDNPPSALVFSTDASYTYTNPGQFYVTLTMDSAGCKFSTPFQSHLVNVLAASAPGCLNGIEDSEFSNAVSMIPNPSNGNVMFTVNGVEKNISIKVFNVIGSEVKSFNASDVATSFTKGFDFSDLANGAYLVKIQTGTKTAVKRLTISK